MGYKSKVQVIVRGRNQQLSPPSATGLRAPGSFSGRLVVLRVRFIRFLVPVPLNGDEIEHRRCEAPDGAAVLMRHVACHRQRFQVNLAPSPLNQKQSNTPPFRFSTDLVKIKKSVQTSRRSRRDRNSDARG